MHNRARSIKPTHHAIGVSVIPTALHRIVTPSKCIQVLAWEHGLAHIAQLLSVVPFILLIVFHL